MLRNLFPVKYDKYVIKAFPKKSVCIHFKTFGMSSSIQKHKHKQNQSFLAMKMGMSNTSSSSSSYGFLPPTTSKPSLPNGEAIISSLTVSPPRTSRISGCGLTAIWSGLAMLVWSCLQIGQPNCRVPVYR